MFIGFGRLSGLSSEVRRIVLAGLIGTALSSMVTAQSSGNSRIDPQALGVIEKALANMGGSNLWATVTDIHVKATCTSKVPKHIGDTWPLEIIVSGNKFRHVAGSNQHVTINNDSDALQVVDGKTHATEGRLVYATRPFQVPGLLLTSALSNPKIKISFVETTTVGNEQAIHLQLEDLEHGEYGNLSTQDWYFSSQTGDLLRVDYQLPSSSDVTRSARVSMSYVSYQSWNGWRTPSQVSKSIEGNQTMDCSIDSFAVNEHPSASVFAAPQAGVQ